MKKVLIVLLILPFSLIWCHGVNHEVSKGAVFIKITYDDGTPMSYSEVILFSPDKQDVEFQQGATDKNGCFAFVPDRVGQWKVVVSDGMGHGVSEIIEIDEGFIPRTSQRGWNKWHKLITGISLIFGLTGLALIFRRKKKVA
ncbi:carboxypeptidase regulatory-like domain-containing protein [bacterium]|nr:carboxypeptidase regulatory-like domain-containing protein [bacterium]